MIIMFNNEEIQEVILIFQNMFVISKFPMWEQFVNWSIIRGPIKEVYMLEPNRQRLPVVF